jgi:hypothetical protein
MLLISVMLVTLAIPASAAIIYTDKGTFEYDVIESNICDFDVHVVGSAKYNVRIREGRNNREQAFFLHNTFSFTETLSANDRYVTVTARNNFNEVRAVPLGEGLFQFFDIFAGRLAVRDANGRLLGQEAGVVRGTYTFDTLNDDQPGGDVLSEFHLTLHGRFDDLDDAICAALAPSAD